MTGSFASAGATFGGRLLAAAAVAGVLLAASPSPAFAAAPTTSAVTTAPARPAHGHGHVYVTRAAVPATTAGGGRRFDAVTIATSLL